MGDLTCRNCGMQAQFHGPGYTCALFQSAADADEIAALRERVAALEGALKPFAKAAAGVAAFDPDYPMEGAALRASFDWYDKAQSEPLKRHSVRRSDLEHARAILAHPKQGGEGG